MKKQTRKLIKNLTETLVIGITLYNLLKNEKNDGIIKRVIKKMMDTYDNYELPKPKTPEEIL